VAEIERRWSRVCKSLRDAMGEVGLSALLERAVARTKADHPASAYLQAQDGARQRSGIMDAVDAHGLDAVESAVTAVIAALVEILARLIGEDMAIRITDPGTARSRPDDTPAGS
jgi:hypothetical protein